MTLEKMWPLCFSGDPIFTAFDHKSCRLLAWPSTEWGKGSPDSSKIKEVRKCKNKTDRNFLSLVPQAKCPILFAPYSATLLFCIQWKRIVLTYIMQCVVLHEKKNNKQEPIWKNLHSTWNAFSFLKSVLHYFLLGRTLFWLQNC